MATDERHNAYATTVVRLDRKEGISLEYYNAWVEMETQITRMTGWRSSAVGHDRASEGLSIVLIRWWGEAPAAERIAKTFSEPLRALLCTEPQVWNCWFNHLQSGSPPWMSRPLLELIVVKDASSVIDPALIRDVNDVGQECNPSSAETRKSEPCVHASWAIQSRSDADRTLILLRFWDSPGTLHSYEDGLATRQPVNNDTGIVKLSYALRRLKEQRAPLALVQVRLSMRPSPSVIFPPSGCCNGFDWSYMEQNHLSGELHGPSSVKETFHNIPLRRLPTVPQTSVIKLEFTSKLNLAENDHWQDVMHEILQLQDCQYILWGSECEEKSKTAVLLIRWKDMAPTSWQTDPTLFHQLFEPIRQILRTLPNFCSLYLGFLKDPRPYRSLPNFVAELIILKGDKKNLDSSILVGTQHIVQRKYSGPTCHNRPGTSDIPFVSQGWVHHHNLPHDRVQVILMFWGSRKSQSAFKNPEQESSSWSAKYDTMVHAPLMRKKESGVVIESLSTALKVFPPSPPKE